jgi:hypothetical protein
LFRPPLTCQEFFLIFMQIEDEKLQIQ